MKAKDLINLLFKVEESKEVQESLFYTQYGTISKFIETMTQNEINARLEEQNHELARLFMYQFTSLKPISLDEFLQENSDQLSDQQKEFGNYISNLF